MRRSLFCSCAVLCLTALPVQAQVGTPGVQYSDVIATGEGGQLYPYDQQDPWLHGQYQRVPAYGGFASFRPYNYRHVFAQTQIAVGWGESHAMPYSQQFWNRYRGSYLQGNLHSQSTPLPAAAQPLVTTVPPIYQASFAPVAVAQPGGPAAVVAPQPGVSGGPVAADGRPIHVYPGSVQAR